MSLLNSNKFKDAATNIAKGVVRDALVKTGIGTNINNAKGYGIIR